MAGKLFYTTTDDVNLFKTPTPGAGAHKLIKAGEKVYVADDGRIHQCLPPGNNSSTLEFCNVRPANGPAGYVLKMYLEGPAMEPVAAAGPRTPKVEDSDTAE